MKPPAFSLRARLLAGLLLAVGGWLPAARSAAPDAGFWDSPEFARRFTGSYGIHSEIEPKFATPEEQALFQQLVPLMRDNPKEAVSRLTAAITPSSSALLEFTLGSLLFQEGDVAGAVARYEGAIARFPDFRRAHRNLGLALAREGRFAEALPALTRTIELGGGDGVVYGLLGYCHLSLEHSLSAEVAYRNAILFAPDNADWSLGLVKALVAQERFREAAGLLEELLQRNPANDSLWALQAGVYVQMDEPVKAAVNYEVLRRMGRATGAQLMLLGDLYMTRESPELALAAYLEGTSAESAGNVTRSLRAAEILVGRGAWEEARALFGRIREVAGEGLAEEEQLRLLKLEARVALASGDAAGAVPVLEQVVSRNPLDGEALLLLGDHHARNDEPAKAAFRFDLAAKIEGFEADAWLKHAQMLVRQRKYDGALELLRKAQKLKPRDNVQRYLEAVERVSRGATR